MSGAKSSRKKRSKGTKLTLKAALNAITITSSGRRRLTLSNMGITSFPKCLLELINIDELDLSRNYLQKLPEGLGSMASLQWLDLHSNKLESVPESIGNLVGLTHLNLSNNCLTSAGLPESLGSLTCLKSLNLGMNKLNELPPSMASLVSLKELGLFDNLFINLPHFVTVLRQIIQVNIKRNPWWYLHEDVEKKVTLSEPVGDMYLVHKSNLCDRCHKKCEELRIKEAEAEAERERRRGRRSGMPEEKSQRTYSGLVTPNSVAKVVEDAWRLRNEGNVT